MKINLSNNKNSIYSKKIVLKLYWGNSYGYIENRKYW